jgi:hypothetical protein
LNHLIKQNTHVIACRPVITEGFPPENEVVPEELGEKPLEAPQMLTLFPLYKASPDAYSTYRMKY